MTADPAVNICPYLSIVIGYTADVVFAGDVEGAACEIVTDPEVPEPVRPLLPVTPVIVPVFFVNPQPLTVDSVTADGIVTAEP